LLDSTLVGTCGNVLGVATTLQRLEL
jgi:hypothetical protein